jgi:hypothetical protein
MAFRRSRGGAGGASGKVVAASSTWLKTLRTPGSPALHGAKQKSRWRPDVLYSRRPTSCWVARSPTNACRRTRQEAWKRPASGPVTQSRSEARSGLPENRERAPARQPHRRLSLRPGASPLRESAFGLALRPLPGAATFEPTREALASPTAADDRRPSDAHRG